jgi:hypothetical protein
MDLGPHPLHHPEERSSYAPVAVSAISLLVWLSGLVPGAAAWALARQDLRAMRAGARDPAGKKAARFALVAGVISVLLSVANCLVGPILHWQLALTLGF